MSLRSTCCDAAIIHTDICSDCGEHADVYCTECNEEYACGTEVCAKCKEVSEVLFNNINERRDAMTKDNAKEMKVMLDIAWKQVWHATNELIQAGYEVTLFAPPEHEEVVEVRDTVETYVTKTEKVTL